jgi:Domain of unknown function (DUF5916)/Carbohydrate family 9 binding domain-like
MKLKIVFAISCSLVLAGFAFSQEAGTAQKAVRVEKGPVLDGDLQDDIWKQAVPFDRFKMVFPNPGMEPTERTELRIVFDGANLYIGVYCYDSVSLKISGNSMVHDGVGEGKADDVVRVLLDPFQDKRNAYVFIVNSRGGRSEGLASGQSASLSWDGIWDAKSRIRADGWSTEMKIPFKTISFKPNLASWGINVERYIARKQETDRLSGTTRNSFFYNPMEAAALEGIGGVKQGLGITFRPYGVVSGSKDYAAGTAAAWKLDGGFDLYKSFTPNFTGSLSYNTDFAETEVDDRRINLTRFPLYFPEKRTFFLEGSGIFNFGGGGENFFPFFSRRIGLFGETQIPIAFGTKFFGKLGNTSLSILDVKTRAFPDKNLSLNLPSENFVAARVYQNVLAESKVGVIFTNGSATGEKNTLAGFDMTYKTSRFMGNQNFLAGGWYVYNWNALKTGKHQAYGLRLDFPNDLLDISGSYSYYGDALNPGLGFLERGDVQSLNLGLAFQPRPAKGTFIGNLVRQFFFELEGEFYWDLQGKLETRQIFTAPLNLRTESGEHIEFNVIPNRDVLPYDFEIAPGVVIPKGPYNFTGYRAEFNSATFRPWTVDLSWRFGQFYSGHYDDAAVGFGFNFKGYVSLALNGEFVRGRLPQGNFNENVYQLKADFFFSPDLGLMNYIQYDDVSKTLGANIRFRWQLSPGNEIYLVYTKNWERLWDPVSRFVPLGERGVFKITLSIRP